MKQSTTGIRARALAGAAASAAYVVGDVLLLSGEVDEAAHPVLRRDDVDSQIGAMLPFSEERLRAGALVGVLATPLYLLGVQAQREALEPAGRAARLAIAALMGAHCLDSYIHGSFYPYGLAFRRADDAIAAGRPEAEVDGLVASGHRLRRAIEAPYLLYGSLVLGSSAVLGVEIARGRTGLPRWAAPLVPPAVPMAVCTAITAGHHLPGRASRTFQGAGLSLGLLASFLATAAIPRRRRRRPRP